VDNDLLISLKKFHFSQKTGAICRSFVVKNQGDGFYEKTPNIPCHSETFDGIIPDLLA